VGHTSHAVEARVERAARERPEPVAEARLTVVGLAAYGARPTRVPPAMREAIEAFEGLAGGTP